MASRLRRGTVCRQPWQGRNSSQERPSSLESMPHSLGPGEGGSLSARKRKLSMPLPPSEFRIYAKPLSPRPTRPGERGIAARFFCGRLRFRCNDKYSLNTDRQRDIVVTKVRAHFRGAVGQQVEPGFTRRGRGHCARIVTILKTARRRHRKSSLRVLFSLLVSKVFPDGQTPSPTRRPRPGNPSK